ncbi:MAG: ECF transporter S component [Coriobacteriaceae bacterium]|jgi:riboflavin transporter FmnP|nr:ECF transporter S component [Coriobacteriaceae bacterium]
MTDQRTNLGQAENGSGTEGLGQEVNGSGTKGLGQTENGSGTKSLGQTENGSGTESPAFKNTNRWDTRQLVTMALLCAIGVLLSFIEFPLLPGVPWLKYDASAMPAMVSGFAWGPGAGVSVGVIGAIIHGILAGDFWGAVMNIIVVVCYTLPAAFIYKKIHTWKGAVFGLVVGCLLSLAGAILGNLAITPMWLGVDFQVVVDMVIPVLTPFNLLKAIINSVLTVVVYKVISNLVTPKKKQVHEK